jgi:hypothetical protein
MVERDDWISSLIIFIFDRFGDAQCKLEYGDLFIYCF